MTEIGIASLLLIIANIFCSVQGLNDHPSFEYCKFNVAKILLGKDYKRIFTAGFFHVNWLHLILNIVSLCCFSSGIELNLGPAKYLLIYCGSLVGGNLFALFLHRRHGSYSAAGASGAVTGIIFATIALFPGFQIGFLGVHFPIPGWFFGFQYVLFSLYGIKSKRDNIGYENQLAGGLAGLMIALLIEPAAFAKNYIAILSIAISSMFFIFIIITRPRFLLIDNLFFKRHNAPVKLQPVIVLPEVDHQQELDLILEKIHQHGIESLTKVEKDKLNHYSKIIQ